MNKCMLAQAVEAKVLDNLSEQTTAEKSASKTAQDIKSLRKQGTSSCAEEPRHTYAPSLHTTVHQTWKKTSLECWSSDASGIVTVPGQQHTCRIIGLVLGSHWQRHAALNVQRKRQLSAVAKLASITKCLQQVEGLGVGVLQWGCSCSCWWEAVVLIR